MAIDKLEVINFQYHSNSTLELHKGLNVIYGDNGQGKSGILRALNWVINNSPSGFTFKKRGSDDKVLVALTVDDQKIIRERNEKINQYRFNKQTFKALRSNVPEEIQKHLNLSEHCYRSQHQPYFLFQDSDGEVAKKLNKVAGLDIIDEVMAKIKKIFNENRSAITTNKQLLKDYKEKFDSYKGIGKLKTNIKKLDQTEQKISELEKTHTNLSELLSNLIEVRHRFESYKPSVSLLSRGKQLLANLDDLNKIHRQHSQLYSFIDLYKQTQEKFEQKKKLSALQPRLKRLQTMAQELTIQAEKLTDLKKIIYNLKTAEKDSSLLKTKIQTLKQEEEKFKKQLKLCPTCNKPF